MSDVNSSLITRLLSNRKAFLEVVIAAILLSLSINLISGCLLELQWISPFATIMVAISLSLICTLYFVVRLLWTRTHTYNFKGFITYDSKQNKVVDIPRYDYGHHLRQYLEAVFAENEAIKKLWDKEPISKELHFDKEAGKVSRHIGKGHQLIVEATEYYVLEELSTHLTDYFNQPHFDEQELQTFARNDIPDVLLANKFLELFSKPMEDRPLFSGNESRPLKDGEIVMAMRRGAFYSRFDLTLPKPSKIKRIDSKTITIETNRFIFKIAVDFERFGTVIPHEYLQHVLGHDARALHAYQINVVFTVSFRFASLFLPGGWDYYRWVESFVESFDQKFSKERYFKDIAWESALTVIQYLERTKSKQEGN